MPATVRSEEHTSELQSRPHLVCRLLLEKKKLRLVRGAGAELSLIHPETADLPRRQRFAEIDAYRGLAVARHGPDKIACLPEYRRSLLQRVIAQGVAQGLFQVARAGTGHVEQLRGRHFFGLRQAQSDQEYGDGPQHRTII